MCSESRRLVHRTPVFVDEVISDDLRSEVSIIKLDRAMSTAGSRWLLSISGRPCINAFTCPKSPGCFSSDSEYHHCKQSCAQTEKMTRLENIDSFNCAVMRTVWPSLQKTNNNKKVLDVLHFLQLAWIVGSYSKVLRFTLMMRSWFVCWNIQKGDYSITLCKPFKEAPNEDASWRENVTHVQRFPFAGLWDGSVIVHASEALFASKFELRRAHPCWFEHYHWKAGKGRLVTYLTLLPHLPALFVTSQTQTTRPKVAALKVVFSPTFRRRFLTNQAILRPRTCCSCEFGSIPMSPRRCGGLYLWHEPTELAHFLLFCACQFCLYGPFNSVLMALSTVFHAINSPDNSPLSYSVLPVSFLPNWSFVLYISSHESLPHPWYNPFCRLGLKHQLTS